MYDRLLLPTDGSDGSKRATEHAAGLAEVHGATVHVLSVVDDNEFRGLEGDSDEAARERARASAEDAADQLAARGVPTETAVREGTPHEAILEYADEAPVDAIVMGTQGRSGVDRLLLGSVTERVVRQAERPVTTVRVTDSTAVDSQAAARERATSALSEAGHTDVEVVEDPHRTSGSWVVTARTADGPVNVHVDADRGTTRIARIDE